MTRSNIASRLATVVASLICLSACANSGGTGSGAATSGAPGLTRHELATRADAVCRSIATESNALAIPQNIGSDAAATARYYGKAALIADRALKAMRVLSPAADVAADWQAFVTAQQGIYRLLLDLKRQATATNPPPTASAGHQATYQRFSTAARKLGAAACG